MTSNSPSSESVDSPRRIAKINTFLGMLGLLLCGLSLFLIRTDVVLTGTGVVEYSHSKRFYAPYEGVIADMSVEEGDWVQDGQPILSLFDADSESRVLEVQRETAALSRRLNEARLDLEAQRIRGADADMLTAAERVDYLHAIQEARQLVLDSIETLRKDGLGNVLDLRRERVAKLESEIATLEPTKLAQWAEKGLPEVQLRRLVSVVEGLSAEVNALEKEARWWEARVGSGTVVAPFSGRLVELARPYVGMGVAEGEFLCRIVDEKSPLQVEALFEQRDIDLAQEGLAVRLSSQVNSSPLGGELDGNVMKVYPFPKERGPEGPMYQIDIALEESRFPPVQGSEMEVEIVLGRRSLFELFRDSLTGIPSRERILTSDRSSSTSHPEPAP